MLTQRAASMLEKHFTDRSSSKGFRKPRLSLTVVTSQPKILFLEIWIPFDLDRQGRCSVLSKGFQCHGSNGSNDLPQLPASRNGVRVSDTGDLSKDRPCNPFLSETAVIDSHTAASRNGKYHDDPALARLALAR